jgi:hypothetical protein
LCLINFAVCIAGGIILRCGIQKLAPRWQVPRQWWKLCRKVVYGMYIKWQYKRLRYKFLFSSNSPSELTFWITYVHVSHQIPAGFLFGSVFNREYGDGMSLWNAGWLLLDYMVTSQETEHLTVTGMRTSNPTRFPLTHHNLLWVIWHVTSGGTELIPLITSHFIPLITCHNNLTCWFIPLSFAFLK